MTSALTCAVMQPVVLQNITSAMQSMICANWRRFRSKMAATWQMHLQARSQ